FDLRLVPDAIDLPLRWRRGRLIFVNSMSDLFHENVPTEYVLRVFAVMREAKHHQFQVLTKRAERLSMLSTVLVVPDNVWIGVSIESEEYLWRICHLRQIKAGIRFLSVEPLLGPIDRLPLDGIHWVIVGGESGHGARPIEQGWVASIRDQCRHAKIPFFF